MFKTVENNVWAFDLEWVPDPDAGRRVYDLPDDMPDKEVVGKMWAQGGATEENPRPYLKTALCRIVSVAVVMRRKGADGDVSIALRSIPDCDDAPSSEHKLIFRFLKAVGKTKPQLVGFSSSGSDLPILIQRGIVHSVSAPAFCKRPARPWNGTDYFYRYGDSHVDLKEIISGWGKATPSLHEIAQVSGIPGKIDMDGSSVVDLWLNGEFRQIVEYNQFDALTTYLIWLRTAHFAGFFSRDEYICEENRVRELLVEKTNEGEEHFARYLEKWDSLGRSVHPESNV